MINKWDKRFLDLAKKFSECSKDPSTKVGAVAVSPDKKDVILGYNGFPSRIKDSLEDLENRDIKISKIIHAEMNIILHCHRSLEGYSIYTYPFISCDRCSIHLIEAGIVRSVSPEPKYGHLLRWKESFERSRKNFKDAGVEVAEFNMKEFR